LIGQNVLARQVIGQWLAPRRRLGRLRYNSGLAFLNTADIAVDIFQCERQLVGIKALGATPEPRALKLFDDCLKTLNLAARRSRRCCAPNGAEVSYPTADC
jgi:hypothetical protein